MINRLFFVLYMITAIWALLATAGIQPGQSVPGNLVIAAFPAIIVFTIHFIFGFWR